MNEAKETPYREMRLQGSAAEILGVLEARARISAKSWRQWKDIRGVWRATITLLGQNGHLVLEQGVGGKLLRGGLSNWSGERSSRHESGQRAGQDGTKKGRLGAG